MSNLRPPGLGPLVGHATHDSCRLWIRAGDPADAGAHLASDRRTLGVIGLLNARGRIEKAYYFRLPREFDRTGVFWLGRDVALGRHSSDPIPRNQQDTPYVLKPDTSYTVRLGTLTVDDPLPDPEVIPDHILAERLPAVDVMAEQLLNLPADECEATFRTFPDPTKTAPELSFLIGSCRYPGLLWKIKEADRIFGPMGGHLTPRRTDPAVRFTLMMGDQIYADTLHRLVPLMRADTYEEFQTRYMEAFSAPNLRRLLRMCPTYMILDDHEIEDNWTQDRLTESGTHQVFNLAIGAYMSYQWSHGPRTWGRLLYYQFECGGYPFFALDTRTQRFKDDEEGLRDNHLLGRPTIDPAHPGQLKRLLDWLSGQQNERGNVPKFIVSASVLAPNPIDERIDPDFLPEELKGVRDRTADILLYEANRRRREKSDAWPAYPATRHAILEHIVKNNIQNVVFLTSDIHCTNIARLKFTGTPETEMLHACDITSSALYWPFPFADGDPNNYIHDSRASGQIDRFPIQGTGIEMHYQAWGFTQEDNFCRLDLDKSAHSLRVRVFDRDGQSVRVTNEDGRLVLANQLSLATWE
jgi:alkaline phosphatase D